jgi:hypothetical protein
LEPDLVFVCNVSTITTRGRGGTSAVADASYTLWTGALLPPGESVRHRFVWRLLLTG